MRLAHAKHAHNTIPHGAMWIIHSGWVRVVRVAAAAVVMTTMSMMMSRMVAAPIIGIIGTGVTWVISGIAICTWHVWHRPCVAGGVGTGVV